VTAKAIRCALGIALAGIFLGLFFRRLNLDELKAVFSASSGYWILAAVAAFVTGYAFRIERWRLMLNQENPSLQWRHCAGPLMASVAVNNLLPLRGGDFLRVFGFNQRLGMSVTVSVATLFVERLLDLLMIVVLLGFALSYFGMAVSHFFSIGGAFLIVMATVLLLVLLFPTFFKPWVIAMGKLTCRLSTTLGQKSLEEINKGFLSLEQMARRPVMAKLILWSALAWIAEGFVFWFAAIALPAILYPLAAWLALPIGTLATLIPSAPGYIGTFDFFTAEAMTVLGNKTTATTAYALLVHALLWLPPTLIGGFYLLLYPVRPHDQPREKGS